jgi:hypothetical protein
MKKIYLLLIIILLAFIVLLLFFINKNTGNNNQQSFITPTPVGVNSQNNEGGGGKIITDPTIIEQDRQSILVSQLIHQTPHEGTNFSLYYDFKKDLFTLYINPSNKDLGESEFAAFLNKNGVDSSSWINNLFITYIKPATTPAP